MNISAKDLRTHTRLLLEAVDRGEEVTITYRGRPRARVVRIDDAVPEKGPRAEEADMFGLWADRADLEDPAEYVEKLRKGRFG